VRRIGRSWCCSGFDIAAVARPHPKSDERCGLETLGREIEAAGRRFVHAHADVADLGRHEAILSTIHAPIEPVGRRGKRCGARRFPDAPAGSRPGAPAAVSRGGVEVARSTRHPLRCSEWGSERPGLVGLPAASGHEASGSRDSRRGIRIRAISSRCGFRTRRATSASHRRVGNRESGRHDPSHRAFLR